MNSEEVKPDDIFECKMCGDCCKGYGGTYLTDKDIENIADFVQIDTASFTLKYCTRSGNRPILDQSDDGYCIFWDEKCTIHPVKPKMCKDWPFLKSVLVDIANWQTMGRSCKGIKTDIPDAKVRDCIRKIRSGD